MANSTEYRCSFCGKTDRQVNRLIQGQEGLICDACVRICCEILGYELKKIDNNKTDLDKED